MIPSIISRADWGARPPAGTLYRWDRPPSYVVWHHTVSPGNGEMTLEQEKQAQRQIQAAHIARGWRDIGQHFTVFQSGRIMEARELQFIGTHAAGFNSRSIGIEHQGNFMEAEPTPNQMTASVELITYLYRRFGWDANPERIIPHSQVSSTACPGTNGRKRLGEVRERVIAALSDSDQEDEVMKQQFHLVPGEAYRQHVWTGRPVWLHLWNIKEVNEPVKVHVALYRWGQKPYVADNAPYREWLSVVWASTFGLHTKVPQGEYLCDVLLPDDAAVELWGDIES